MPLVILSRRNISYREPGRGETTVLLVPGRDQIQVVKDLAGLNNTVTAQTREVNGKTVAVGKKQVQLSRVHTGRRYIYGTLPNEISDLRQPVKVWLAEDYAPIQSQAFFYIFSNTVIIHGVREQDDEGHQTWRTAQLAVDIADPVRSIINAISDYALANPVDTLTVAVQSKLDLYEKLQAGLATYNISPIPFSKLKPQTNLKPLYRHRDYTIMYLTLALFGFIMLLASGSYAFLTYLQLSKLEQEAVEIQQRIDNIKLNQNVGNVSDPQSVLTTMGKAINQQPSAIIDAAGSLAANFGRLAAVKALITPDAGDSSMPPTQSGQLNVLATIEKMKDELLITQEQAAAADIANRPWVREVRRGGTVGARGDLIITLQVDKAPSSTVPAFDPTPAETTDANVSGTTVSGTLVSGTQVSGTVVSSTLAAEPLSIVSGSTPSPTVAVMVTPTAVSSTMQGGK